MKVLAFVVVAGSLLSLAALADERDNDRRVDRDHKRHRYQHEHDRKYPQGVTKIGDPNPYEPKVGAPNPYATQGGTENPYATRGGDPARPLSDEKPRRR